MPQAGDVLDLSPIGAIFYVKKSAAETQGRSFEMEWELAPASVVRVMAMSSLGS